jgi:hypothetical protein
LARAFGARWSGQFAPTCVSECPVVRVAREHRAEHAVLELERELHPRLLGERARERESEAGTIRVGARAVLPPERFRERAQILRFEGRPLRSRSRAATNRSGSRSCSARRRRGPNSGSRCSGDSRRRSAGPPGRPRRDPRARRRSRP